MSIPIMKLDKRQGTVVQRGAALKIADNHTPNREFDFDRGLGLIAGNRVTYLSFVRFRQGRQPEIINVIKDII